MHIFGAGSWLPFVGITILTWGAYGVLLHTGQIEMADPQFGRYKAFLFVGIAYLLTAVIAPVILLWSKGADGSFTTAGVTWSLLAGVAGAAGAFCVLLAFGAKASPAVVMSLVFAGAPVVNAVITISVHKQWSQIRWPFVLGILLAAVGAYLVVAHKPGPGSTEEGPQPLSEQRLTS